MSSMKSKKIALLSLLALALTFTAFHKADAQRFYVSVRPVEPVYVHPVRPSPRHVWVESEWEWRNGAYVHHPGYWALPPRPGSVAPPPPPLPRMGCRPLGT